MRSQLPALLVIAALAGCRNQPAMTNPFLTPDRVPPPSTRVIAPGTAQPYYPGDPLPGAATAPPATGVPPATAYPGAAYPPSTAPLTTPPGGWGAYPPQSQTFSTPSGVQQASAEAPIDSRSSGDAVRLSGDALPLRFPPPEAQPAGPATLPAQSVAQSVVTAPVAAFPPNAGAQAPQQLQIREITPAEYLAPVTPPPATVSARDGFRPQGSESRDDSDTSQSFRPPEIRKASVAQNAAGNEYGIGDNYAWLRGQLEYWPSAGQWSLRYVPPGAPPDTLGGRVIIDNPQVLANLQPGEFVMIRGLLFSKPTDTGATAPAYRVSVIQRQRL